MQSYQEDKPIPSPFKMICEAADHDDEVMLNLALGRACIDVWHEPVRGTPVTAMAAKGNVKAVKFLIDRGAVPGYAACGYARSGLVKEAEELWEDVKNNRPLQLEFFLRQMLYGFALHGDTDTLDACWNRIKREHPDKIPFLLGSLSMGLAQSGQIDKANQILKEAKEKYPQKVSDVYQSIAVGLALYENSIDGDMTQSVEFLAKILSEQHVELSKSTAKMMVTALARQAAGNAGEKVDLEKIELFLEILRDQFGFSRDSFLYAMTKGIARAGKNIVLMPAGQEDMDLARTIGFAQSGHKVEAYASGEEYNYARLQAFAAGGYVKEAYENYAVIAASHRMYNKPHKKPFAEAVEYFLENGRLEEVSQFTQLVRNNWHLRGQSEYGINTSLMRLYSQYGYDAEANKLLEDIPEQENKDNLLCLRARTLARYGYFEKVYALLYQLKTKNASLESIHNVLGAMMQGFRLGRHDEEIYSVFLRMVSKDFPGQQIRLLSTLTSSLQIEEMLGNKEITPEVKSAFAKIIYHADIDEAKSASISQSRRKGYTLFTECYRMAERSKESIEKLKLSYNQLAAVRQPQMRELLIITIKNMFRGLPHELTAHLMTFLTEISPQEASSLIKKRGVYRPPIAAPIPPPETKTANPEPPPDTLVMHTPILQEGLTHADIFGELSGYNRSGFFDAPEVVILRALTSDKSSVLVTPEEIKKVLKGHRLRLFEGKDFPDGSNADDIIDKIRRAFENKKK